MFIPAPAQDLHLPLTQKLEASPVMPVTAVAGVAEEAQSLDSRVALQWTQPVFAGAEGQAGRTALASPVPEALLQSPKTAVPGYEPQGADPDALKSGDVHPLLAQGLSSWLSGVLAKSSGAANIPEVRILLATATDKAVLKAAVNEPTTNTNSKATSEVTAQIRTASQASANSSFLTSIDKLSTSSNTLATSNSPLSTLGSVLLPSSSAASVAQQAIKSSGKPNVPDQAPLMSESSELSILKTTENEPATPKKMPKSNAPTEVIGQIRTAYQSSASSGLSSGINLLTESSVSKGSSALTPANTAGTSAQQTSESIGKRNVAEQPPLMTKSPDKAVLNAKANEPNIANATTATAAAAVTSTNINKNIPSEVMVQLKQIYQAIAGSDVFAAQRLNEAWMPRRVLADTALPPPEPQLESQIPKSQRSNTPLALNPDLAEIQKFAQPSIDPSSAQLTQWVSALEPDSDAAQQAARMLAQGNIVWQADLVPGMPMRIVREDAWRNHPQQAGQLEKGAMLKVEIKLPNLGELRIVGSQWGQDISLHISHGTKDNNGRLNWAALAPSLVQELKAKGVEAVRVDSLPQEIPNV
jgi:hypothetical protein